MSQVINKPKILIVDDLPANLLSMKSLLKNINVDIITAESGNTALSIAVQHNLALILLDINMPEMDGFEVASCLMEIEETKIYRLFLLPLFIMMRQAFYEAMILVQ